MPTAIYIRVSSPKGQKTDSQRAELEAWLKRLKAVQWFGLCWASGRFDTNI